MINAIVLGIWVCLVTLGASYGAIVAFAPEKAPVEKASYFGGLDYAKTEMIGVPIIRDEALQGYVLVQLVYTIEQKLAKTIAVQPDIFLVDHVYQRIYADPNLDYRRLKPQNLAALLGEVRSSVNERYGKEVVRDLLLERLTYLSAEAVRKGNYQDVTRLGGQNAGVVAADKH